ncbi:hypothetical protein NL676_003096 [Syzygium grande]|nr:hypothetical protein NL676_003096 [Syzygium grande]
MEQENISFASSAIQRRRVVGVKGADPEKVAAARGAVEPPRFRVQVREARQRAVPPGRHMRKMEQGASCRCWPDALQDTLRKRDLSAG